MPLDCNSERGRIFIDEQRRTERRLQDLGYIVIRTGADSSNADVLLASPSDGGLKICAIAEIKSREFAGRHPLTREYLASNGGYLITNEKLKFGAMMAAQLSAPFYVIVSLMQEGVILMWQITDKLGNYLEPKVLKQTETQATCNGGKVVRTNAFLSMGSKYLKVIE